MAVYADGNIFDRHEGFELFAGIPGGLQYIGSDLTITILPAETYIRSHHQKTITWQQSLSHHAAIIVSLDTYTGFCVMGHCNTDGVLSLPLSAAVAILVHQSEL